MAENAAPYKYWAFVSYSHHDKRVAKRLLDEFARRRIPGQFRDRVEGKLPRFAALFRDERDVAAASSLEPALIEALDRSAKLVVICSPFAAASDYVAGEIAHFVARGRASDILCLVASGVPNATDGGRPQLECFPWPLRERLGPDGTRQPVPLNERPLAATLGEESKQEWADAVDQLAAGLLGVSRTDLRRLAGRSMVRRAAWAAAAALVVLGGGFHLWDRYFATHVAYYRDYQRRDGIWRGVDPVSKEVADRLERAYAFSTTGSSPGPAKVALVAHGVGCPHSGLDSILGNSLRAQCSSARACEARFEYTDKGRIKSEALHDQFGREIERLSYDKPDVGDFRDHRGYGCGKTSTGIKYISFERHSDEAGPLAGLTKSMNFFHDAATPRADPSGVFGKKFDYMPDGKVKSVTFIDEKGAVTTGDRRYAGWANEYYPQGWLKRRTYVGPKGNAVFTSDGSASVTYRYDPDGREIERRNFDPRGKAVLDNNGAAGVRWKIGAHGLRDVETRLGLDGEPAAANDGIAVIKFEYDEQRYQTRRLFFSADGRRPVRTGQGSWGVAHDRQGNLEEGRSLDADGVAPVSDASGYAAVLQTFDSVGNLVREFYIGKDKQRVFNAANDPGKEFVWKENRRNGQTYIGLDDKPTSGPSGVAEEKYLYDSYGNLIEERYYDRHGRATVDATGVYGGKTIFERGKQIEAMALDVAEKKGVGEKKFGRDNEGTSITKSVYQGGRLRERRYLNAKSELSPLASGVAIERFDYDEMGNRTKVELFDEKDEKVVDASAKYHRLEIGYDERGRKTDERFFDVRGETDRGGLGHWIHYEYDPQGRVELLEFRDAQGQPSTISGWGNLTARITAVRFKHDDYGRVTARIGDCTKKDGSCDAMEGIAIVLSSYERRGWETERRFFDASDRKVADAQGRHGWQAEYNDAGLVILRCEFDVNDKKVPVKGQTFACEKRRYHPDNLHVESTYFDDDDRRSTDEGCSSTRWEHDDWRRIKTYACYAADGERAESRRNGYHRSTRLYDQWGNLRSFIFFDAKEARTTRSEGGRRISRIDREYDIQSRVVAERYLGTRDERVEDDQGVHEIKRRYLNGKETLELLDLEGQPVVVREPDRYALR